MKKLFPLWLAALLCLVGCTNEEIANAPIKKGTIQATFENSASRLVIGENNALTWSEGDAFKMFDAEGVGSSTWTLEGTGGEETGTFGTTDEVAEELKGAAFPASVVTSLEGNVLTMTLPKEVTFKEGICNLPMWASFESLDAAVSFKHLGALLKIDFKEIPAGYNKLIVTADKPLAGVFTADLSKVEPVLAAAEQGAEKSVKITFDASTSKQDKMFYLPLPVGEYASIKVTIQGEDNLPELTIAEWANRTIVRKKVYLASLTYKTSAAVTTEAIDAELGDTKTITLEVTEKVTDVTKPVTLPTDAVKVGLNFTEVPETSANTPLTIKETGQAEEAELSISIPASDTPDSYLTLDVPNTTVTVESGNYKCIVATTAANTLVLGKGTKVEELVIKAGNVVLDGAEVKKISRYEGTDDIIYVFVKGTSALAADALGEGVQEPDYVTFKAETAQTFALTKAVETLEYSVGGAAWAELSTATVEFGPVGDLRVRGKSAIGTATSFWDYATVRFVNTSVLVAASGDIRTLVDYENYTSDALDTSNARFMNLFSGNKVLTKAPALPATTLADNCYESMFNHCTALTESPVLPATTLAKNCYSSMFNGCTGLIKAGDILATTLANYSCSMMFYGCSNLTEAPALPATTLAVGCYENMFRGCSNLTVAPQLPATTLADYCYRYMLQDCNLSEAPVLPATTLANWCYSGMFINNKNLTESPVLPALTLNNYSYRWMFEGCTSLNEVTMLATNVSASNCLDGWLNGVSSTGILHKNSSLEDVSALGIPSGWTVEGYKYEIRYTSTDGNVVTPYSNVDFGANIVSNTYENGVGIIEFDGPVTAIGNQAFYQCATLETITIPNTVTNIGSSAFYYCQGLTSIEIPNSVTNIGSWAFHNCTVLESVTLPKYITDIKENTFNHCDALKSIVIPDGVTTIGWGAFRTNLALTSVTLPKELVTIADQAFKWCDALPSITIPEKVTSIGAGAFVTSSTGTVLATVYCKAATPPALGDNLVFSSAVYPISINVPAASLNAYTEAWGSLTGCTLVASTEF